MGRKPAAVLTDAELLLMEALWQHGRATVTDVLEELPEPRPTYNSVQTRLNILTDKGYAVREERGRAFAYRAAVKRDRVISSAVNHLVSRFFAKGSLLALRLIADEPMTDAELSELEEAISKRARKRK